jgi:DNA-binding XRE family transcriptional regulator
MASTIDPADGRAGDYTTETVTATAGAVALLRKLIASLPLSPEAREDIWGYVMDLSEAKDDEDRAYIMRAVRETLEGAKGGVTRHELATSEPKSEGYRKWVSWISARVNEERKLVGLTQEQLAEKSGLPQSHISRIETGKHSPSHATLEKIAKALNKPMTVFDPSAGEDAGVA